jgi:hypothetical protein
MFHVKRFGGSACRTRVMVGEPYQHHTWHTATSLATRLEQSHCFIDGLLMDDALDNEHYKISLSFSLSLSFPSLRENYFQPK